MESGKMEYQQYQGVCVVGQQFCLPYPIELTIQQEGFIFGGDFTVTDSGGNVVFTVAENSKILQGRRWVLQDAAGNPLVTLKQKTFTMHRRWEAFRGKSSDQQNLLFTERKSSVIQVKTVLDVFLEGNEREEHNDFKVEGSYLDLFGTIYRGDHIVAEMKRKFVMIGKDKFVVAIPVGIDYCFIVALIVILNEINKDRHLW